jgi:Ni/Co efflux regulator RcnB
MKRPLTAAALLAASSLVAMPSAAADDAALIKSAESAAPAAVARDAAVHAMDEKGNMRTLREGTNGFRCMPDNPVTPGSDPMCGDANSMEWAMALMQKKEPPKGKVGFMYMLAGGSDASNTDPYATKPEAGNNWVETGPHVMIVNATDMMQGYPTDPTPDTSRPYVMWAGTPYAHLMIPVK